MSNTIYNLPYERASVTYPFVWWDDLFSNEQLDFITKYCDDAGVDEATVLGTEGINRDIRRSGTKFHKRIPELAEFFNQMNAGIQMINDQFYEMDLNGYEDFQYTTYDESYQGTYDWHMDICLGTDGLPNNMIRPRKLSLSLLLTTPGIDFEGGEFQFNTGREAAPLVAEQKRGRILAFPSFVCHRVTPITKGIRKSIVVWTDGPKFK